jgi:serine-type D-Ala-D-Ala carboxypeptidase (penicillin-binding protein 5/6)
VAAGVVTFRSPRMKFLAPVLALLWCAAMVDAAPSHLVFDQQTGKILLANDARKKLPVASLTKIATAMVVLDWANLRNADLSQVIHVPPAAFDGGPITTLGLRVRDGLSIRDLLYCALLSSDNVAAATLAAHVGANIPNPQGLNPIDNFVANMNALARTLGMDRTLFLNPTGMDHMTDRAVPYSTARDIALLSRHAMNNPGFAFYVSQRDRTVHIFRNGEDIPKTIKNTNTLLGTDSIDGVKTGHTRRAGGCLVLSSELLPESARQGDAVQVTPRHIGVVVLGSTDRFREGLSLVRTGWQAYGEWAAQGRPIERKDTILE